MYYLYYAGMADDVVNEQIGLAISENGVDFKRVGADGLIIARDPQIPWKGLRVCNPTVLKNGDEFVMFYQGISNEGHENVSLGIAFSSDGITWNGPNEPILHWRQVKEYFKDRSEGLRTGLIEPSVIIENGIYRMWFVYISAEVPGNAICYAESKDGRTWSLREEKLITGNQFGNFRIHYPQVIAATAGYEMWFTMRYKPTGVFGIYKATSKDGFTWSEPSLVVPASDP